MTSHDKQPVNDTLVVMARIGRAHGLRGEVRATSFAADPLGLGDYGPLTDGHGRSFTIAAIRPQGGAHPDGVVIRLKGVDNRDAAEALNGVELKLPRERLPAPDEEEFYHADLIGLAARDPAGATLGTVTAVHDFGAGDMLELRLASGKPVGGRSVMIPFSRAAVPELAIAAGFLTVDPGPAGLLPDSDDDADGDTDESEGG